MQICRVVVKKKKKENTMYGSTSIISTLHLSGLVSLVPGGSLKQTDLQQFRLM